MLWMKIIFDEEEPIDEDDYYTEEPGQIDAKYATREDRAYAIVAIKDFFPELTLMYDDFLASLGRDLGCLSLPDQVHKAVVELHDGLTQLEDNDFFIEYPAQKILRDFLDALKDMIRANNLLLKKFSTPELLELKETFKRIEAQVGKRFSKKGAAFTPRRVTSRRP